MQPLAEVNVEKFINHCTVNFNKHCEPDTIMTAADSRKILLSNLPSDCSVAEARSLADKYGAVKEVTFLHEQADSVTMAIE